MSLKPIVETALGGQRIASEAPARAFTLASRSLLSNLIGFLASLKLTVVLMVTAVLVILTFTFQLTRMDIWQAKSLHFPHLVVYIPLQTFFPPKWFPEWQSVPGGFLIPSGFLILSAMLINLLAAHLSRFRIVGTRSQVLAGTILLAIGTALAAAVIWNGQNPYGFQSKPPIPWTTLWNLLQAGLALCAATSLFIGIRLGSDRMIERIGLIAGGAVLATLFTFLAIRGPAAFIGDSAMRILWQMLQCLAPSLVLYFGARQIFGRKAGMVMIHAGVAILMLNEIYTSVFTIEQRIQFFEGEKANYAIDLRHNELAIVDLTDPAFEEHVAVPESRLVPNQLLQDPQLSVDLMVVDFYRNSMIEPLRKDDPPGLATAGIGQVAVLRELAAVSGTGDQVDQAGAYVKIFDKQSRRELGTFLVNQTVSSLEEARRDDPAFPQNEFEVGDRRYRVSLRFKRYYKPYTLTLHDVEKQSYLGTTTPRHFSSTFRLEDSETGIDVTQKVWMNNPLRYRNETFYQANYDVRGGREISELQVVKNSGWMIPYFCCVFVGFGLVIQFGQTLVGYTKKLNQQLRTQSAQGIATNPLAWTILAIPLLIVVGGLRNGVSGPASADGMRTDLLGRIPIVHLGRAKPLDSAARSLVRRSSGLESVRKGDDETSRVDATTWLANVMFAGKDFDQFQVFKIDDPSLRSSLNLEPRKRYRYSISEVQKNESELQRLYDEASAKETERQTAFDHRTIELGQLLSESREFGKLLNVDWDGKHLLDLYFWYAVPDSTRKSAMFIAPLPGKEQGLEHAWGTITMGLFCQEMVERAKQYGVATCSELARRVVEEENEVVRDHEIRLRLFRALAEDDQIRIQSGGLSKSQWQKYIFDQIRAAPMAELEKMSGSMATQIDQQIESVNAMQAQVLAEDLQNWLGNESLAAIGKVYDCRLLTELRDAFQANDAALFNERLEKYLASIEETPPLGFTPWKQSWESYYNRFSPFYLATICYLIGFILTALSWMVIPVWLNRIASAVLFGGWILHLIGIVMLIGISGRAPVTGLYSSFLFVTCVVVAAFVSIERFTRMGLGNLLGSILGVAGLMWAWNIALGTEDTFAVLVAVLDTNFWLSTHVICVSLGYSATLAAGALGATYILGGLFTPWLNVVRRQELTRLIYGTVCFGLLFSFVGTVLGGLWADDSWGRFWGWDPKENGALMIVLWNAVVLHARWGGLVRQRGMAALAVIGNAVTAWSWEGVNQLGVGLHAYALSDANKFMMLVIFWAAQFVIAGLALIPQEYWWSQDKKSPLTAAKPVHD